MAEKKNSTSKSNAKSNSKSSNQNSKSNANIEKKVKKTYKTAKKNAKKKGKLKQFYIVVALLLVLAIAAGVVWYFFFYEMPDDTNNNLSTSFTFDVYDEANFNNYSIVENRGKLEVHYINVGQADCILIMLPDGRNMLIDAGGQKDYNKHLKEYLAKNKIKTIDYALLTHTDADHVESFDDVLDICEVKNLFIPQLYPSWEAGTAKNRYKDITADRKDGVINTKAYYDFFTRADDETYKENGMSYDAKVFPNVDFMNISGEGYEIDIFCMPKSTYNKKFSTAKQKNEISPTVVLTYQGYQFLFTGDGVGTSHDNFLNEFRKRNPGVNPDFDVYKAAHHGSATEESNNAAFLEEIETEYTVISVKEGSYNDVPSDTVMKNMKKYGNKIYRTDLYGDVVFGVENNLLLTPEQMVA